MIYVATPLELTSTELSQVYGGTGATSNPPGDARDLATGAGSTAGAAVGSRFGSGGAAVGSVVGGFLGGLVYDLSKTVDMEEFGRREARRRPGAGG